MADKKTGFRIVNGKEPQSAEIYIYEEIGESWFGGISAKKFKDDLKEFGSIKTLDIHINSPGGSVFDGTAIYNLLKQHAARIRVKIDALAASIASVIAMAGDEIHMAENGLMMIHNAWGFAVGDAEEMRKEADLLDKVNGTIRTTYVKRTGLDESKITDMMDAETWMDAKEAKELGFIDGTIEDSSVSACFDINKFNYKNVPEKLKVASLQNHRFRLAKMNISASKIRRAGAGMQSGPALTAKRKR